MDSTEHFGPGDTDVGQEAAPERKPAWECPSCGQVYDRPGVCPVDQTPLRATGPWTETAEKSETEEVMEEAERHYPTMEGHPR